MLTTEQLATEIARLPERDMEHLKTKLEELIDEKKHQPKAKRGEKLMALAGRVDLGQCLIPYPDSEMLYGED